MSDPTFDARAGLCSLCANARTVPTARGSVFWMCELFAADPRYRRYPALPVTRCGGFAPRATPPLSG